MSSRLLKEALDEDNDANCYVEGHPLYPRYLMEQQNVLLYVWFLLLIA